MKDSLVGIVRILGVVFNEVIIDINLDDEGITINSIEVDKYNNIILHAFNSRIDVEIPYDEISENDRLYIYHVLSSLLYN